MRFLRPKWGRFVLPICSIGLLFGFTLIFADERPTQASAEEPDVDLAKLQSGGRVVFVSSGARPSAFHAIDDDRRTTFRFSSADLFPTVIIELAGTQPVHRVSVVPGSTGGKIDVYLVNKLPADPRELAAVKPVAAIVDLVVGREASADFAPQTARYVALRWTQTKVPIESFEVAEISAFASPQTPEPPAALAAADPPIYLVAGPPVVPPVSP